MRIKARGTLAEHEGGLALQLPGPPWLLALEGGEKLAELEAAGLPEGARLELDGPLRAADGDEPPALEVEGWREPESADPG